ncbi:MAG: elongation factor G [Chloroflexota bacterium]
MENIRNVVMLSHSGAGKTTLGEIILFSTGTISRLGRVEDGSATSDYEPESVKRRISLGLALLPFKWQDTKINLIDTPGYSDFVGEVAAALRVSEGAVLVVDAAAGVQVGTEQVWGYSEAAKIPRLIFVNKMDRENADFNRTLEGIQSKFGSRCVPLQLPVGAHTSFKGFVDLLKMKTYLGNPAKESDISGELKAQADSLREKLVEAVADVDDKLIEKYLGGEALSLEETNNALRQGVLTGKIVPVLAGSALQSIGISYLLDAIKAYLPSPKEREIVLANGETMQPAEDGALTALVFKTSADPYVGKLTYFRVYSGTIESNSQVWNANREVMERIGQLFVLRGKNQETVAKLGAGDIGAVAKLTQTVTGDTLASREKPVKIAPPVFPEPIFSGAVHPKTKSDVDKMGSALARLVEEDPTVQMRREADTSETILAGVGETQLEVAVDKMQRKFGVGVELVKPKVPYKETIKLASKAEFKHKKQTGGHGQYGHVCLSVEPLPRGTGFEFADKVVGGAIPRNFIPAVEKGVLEGATEGVLAGYPVIDVRATVYDGSFHPVDSSEICFKIAGAQALKKGLAQSQSVILEPIMDITVTVPDEYTGDIISDLNGKRARVMGMNPAGGVNTIDAEIPLSEALRYAIDLKSITQGRGTYKLKFSHYEEVPPNVAQRIIAEREQEKAAAKEA